MPQGLLQSLRQRVARARTLAGPARAFRYVPSDCLSFSPPEFLGVTQSTRTLFTNSQPLSAPDLATAARRQKWTRAVQAAGARIVVLSGFDDGYAEAAAELHARAPELHIRAVWHGSTLQLADAIERRHLESLLELGASGVIERIAFLKRGMDVLFAELGVHALPLMNYVKTIPQRASTPARDEGLDLGIWFAGASWRKNPYAMLCAAALLPNARIEGVLNAEARSWCKRLGLPLGVVVDAPLPRPALADALARQDCNLYVTLSECSPLLPLESLAAGAPCLVAPNSHLFEDDAALADALVVTRIDDPHAIAERVSDVVQRRQEIVGAYARYALEYNARACALRDRFLEF